MEIEKDGLHCPHFPGIAKKCDTKEHFRYFQLGKSRSRYIGYQLGNFESSIELFVFVVLIIDLSFVTSFAGRWKTLLSYRQAYIQRTIHSNLS